MNLTFAADRHVDRFDVLFGPNRSNAGPDPARDTPAPQLAVAPRFALDAGRLDTALLSLADNNGVDNLSVADLADTPAAAISKLVNVACTQWNAISAPDGWSLRYRPVNDDTGQVAVTNTSSFAVHAGAPSHHTEMTPTAEARQGITDCLNTVIEHANELLAKHAR